MHVSVSERSIGNNADKDDRGRSGKRLCKVSPISRWNPGRNSLTIQLQLRIPRPTLSRESSAVWRRPRDALAPRGKLRGGCEGGEPRFSKCYADFCLASHYWGVCRHDSHCYSYLGPISTTTTIITTTVATITTTTNQPTTPFNGRRPSTARLHPYPRYSYQLSGFFLPLSLACQVCIASMNIYPPFR